MNCQLKNLIHTFHLFTAALDVQCAHALCDCPALLGSDRCQTLCLEKLNASALGSKVGLEPYKDERSCWAEMEDFGVPLVASAKSGNTLWGTYLVHDILKRIRAVNGKADEQQICFRIGERS